MKKVLLLNPPVFNNNRYIRSGYCNSVSKGGYYWEPIDLLVQSGILKNKFEIFVLDATAEYLDAAGTIKKIQDMFDELYGLFFITSLASKDYDFEFIKLLKSKIVIYTVLVSGGYLLFENKSLLESELVDGVLLDYTSDETIDFFDLKFKKSYKTISTYKKNLTVNELNKTLDKSFEYPIPMHLEFPISKYYMPNCKTLPMVNIITNLGCPYKCEFCTWSKLKYRNRTPENTIEELIFLNKNNIKEIMFIDPTFGANRKNTFELLNLIIKNNIRINFSIECRVDLIDEKFVELLSKAGCHSITFGLESGSDEILKNIKKGITTDDIRTAFELCHKYNIAPTGHFIIGLPGETERSVQQTIDLACEINCDFASFNIIMHLPGTGMIKDNSYKNKEIVSCSDIEKPNVATDDLSSERIYELSKIAFRKFYLRPSYIIKTFCKIMNVVQMKILLKESLFFFKKLI